ncbi:hypothetical protein CTAM01_12536 [Colletotrichum tamarilloi]|uniref:Uncharacterized protein n=1 Tax=Colletotrichum tamarilloi TaxID=1209934 RepID=A0ABQ9QUF8_9PEZI|nr:uncharacterized protein CTAM01_12536 [Colletotrichum tamarilloi]KAK1485468.1 hypothetical protein CTAM01_12536 [Colletotrichum tamarilloi]
MFVRRPQTGAGRKYKDDVNIENPRTSCRHSAVSCSLALSAPPNKEDGDAYRGKWHESHNCAEEHDIERLTHMLGRVRVRNDTKDIGHEGQARANDQCSNSIQLFSQANKSIPAQRRGVINANWKCPQGKGQNNDMKDRSSMKPPSPTDSAAENIAQGKI